MKTKPFKSEIKRLKEQINESDNKLKNIWFLENAGFEKVNKLVMSHRYRSRSTANLYLLDYNKCLKLKNTIEKEIKAKKNDTLEGI